jgi:hypothetical protein
MKEVENVRPRTHAHQSEIKHLTIPKPRVFVRVDVAEITLRRICMDSVIARTGGTVYIQAR